MGPLPPLVLILAVGSGTDLMKAFEAAEAQCEADASARWGMPPSGLDPNQTAPKKKLVHKNPRYPSRTGPSVGRGSWAGEALIGVDGNVVKVWAVREIQFEPPWPEFNRAISDSIRHWKYRPVLVGGKAVPICMAVSVLIHWR